MDSPILLSFIVPAYNVEHCIARCLDSILNQTIKNFEVIVVNDGSTDNTQHIIESYAQRFPDSLKAYTKENGGPGDTRNYGISKATGNYIAFVDSDDFIEPDYAQKVNDLIDEHNPDMLVISYNRVYTKKQNIFERVHKFNKWHVYNQVVNIDAMPEMICNIEGASWLRIIRREMFAKNDSLFYSNKSLAEDLEVSLKWYLHAAKIIVSNEKIYNYVITTDSLNSIRDNINQFIEVIETVCTYYKKHGKFHDCYGELEYIFAKHMIISNIIRFKASKHKNNFKQFMELRAVLRDYFLQYMKNKYFKNDPFYIRMAIKASYYFPRVFYPLFTPLLKKF